MPKNPIAPAKIGPPQQNSGWVKIAAGKTL
jgi:hypothetical protein